MALFTFWEAVQYGKETYLDQCPGYRDYNGTGRVHRRPNSSAHSHRNVVTHSNCYLCTSINAKRNAHHRDGTNFHSHRNVITNDNSNRYNRPHNGAEP